jgi:hypothetical protein
MMSNNKQHTSEPWSIAINQMLNDLQNETDPDKVKEIKFKLERLQSDLIKISENQKKKRKIIGFTINSIALLFIIFGFTFYSSFTWQYWLIESHGILLGIFGLGTVIQIRNAINNRRNS